MNNAKKIRFIIIAAAVTLIVGVAIALASHLWAEDPKDVESTTTTPVTNADGTCAHTYTRSVVEVTKETDGYALYTCSRCSASYKNEYKYATGSEGLKFDPNNSGFKVVKSEGCTDENVVIPAVVEGKKVMWIDGEAFYKNTTMKSVKILGKLDRIGTCAFAGCTSLTDIYYVGKKEEWEKMPKGDKWDADMPSYTVHCSDGDITK
jgi:hypothetical protein